MELKRNIDLTGRRLLICEERLKNMHGHFFEWNKELRKINEQAGASVDMFVHRDIEPNLRDELKATPFFHTTLDDKAPSLNRIWRYANFLVHSHRAYRQAKQALAQSGPVDMVMVSNTPEHQLLAWSQICVESLGSRFQRLVLFFIKSQAYYVNSDPNPHFGRRARLFSQALKRLKPAFDSGRVLLCSDSDQIAKEYSLLSGLTFTEIPLPRFTMPSPKRVVGDPITIASLGPPRAEKGSEELLQAIEILRHRPMPRPVKFLVQWPCDFKNEKGSLVTIPSSWQSDSRIEVVRKYYNSGDYENALMRCDCLLLPYRSSDYYNRMSSMVVDAALAGIPTIVVKNTCLHRAQRKYGAGLTCKDRDAQDLAHTIAQCCEQIEELSPQANARAGLAQAHHASERLLRFLWGMPEEIPAQSQLLANCV